VGVRRVTGERPGQRRGGSAPESGVQLTTMARRYGSRRIVTSGAGLTVSWFVRSPATKRQLSRMRPRLARGPRPGRMAPGMRASPTGRPSPPNRPKQQSPPTRLGPRRPPSRRHRARRRPRPCPPSRRPRPRPRSRISPPAGASRTARVTRVTTTAPEIRRVGRLGGPLVPDKPDAVRSPIGPG
jgi:hypothetical protein